MDLVAYVPHHPLPGETLTADRFATSPGGKGANQAVACVKLSRARPQREIEEAAAAGGGNGDGGDGDGDEVSATVSMLGAVGADAHGAALRASLARYGVDVAGVRDAAGGTPTGVAMIVVDVPTGENRIVLSPGANHALQPADVSPLAKLFKDGREDGQGREGRLPDLLIMQLEIPLETVLAALEAARHEKLDVLLNPAPARQLPDEAYSGLAHLVVNETEAAILAGAEEKSLEDEAGLEEVARVFVSKGVQHVVVTLGARGVYYFSADGRKGLVPAEKAKVVDTTAAGDTFVGRYALDAVGRRRGEFDIEAAVRRANKAAAKTVERAGAQASIPWRDELE
jgi:ribokinase